MSENTGIEPQAITLFELATRIGGAIHTNPHIQNVWVVAELSDVAVRGGHFYADLIQKDDAGRTVAKIRANLWASRFASVRSRYFAERQEDLRNGIKVRILGSATHHNQYGLSFNITDIDPTFVDEGDMLRRRMEILKKLADEGIAENNKQVPLPVDSQRIAIISAHGAAGLGDFINQLDSNPGRFKFTYRVFNSPMQGERAPGGVIAALNEINACRDEWDCVVIIRGGGATTDMNCFDDYELGRYVCYFELPVIVGIGHERDNCVLDYIAHTRCKTPTAVAEFLIDHQRQAWQRAADAVNRIVHEATLRMDGERRHLAQVEAFVPSMATQLIEREKLRIKNFSTSVPLASNSITTREHTRLDGYRNLLEPAAAAAISKAREKLRSTFGMIEVLKPENTLKRGYSITRVNGKAIREADGLSSGAVIETQLGSGSIKSSVI